MQYRRYIKRGKQRERKVCKEALLLKVPREKIVINCPLCSFQYICWTYFGPSVPKLNLSSFYQFIFFYRCASHSFILDYNVLFLLMSLINFKEPNLWLLRFEYGRVGNSSVGFTFMPARKLL